MTAQPVETLALLTLDIPRPWLLNANVKLHWRRRGERASWIRALAGAQARHLKMRSPLEPKVRCEVLVAWPDRRRRDVHNLMPTIKPCIDGIVDAGVLVDDSDRYMLGPDLRVADHLCRTGFACQLTFTFTEVPS